MHKFLSLVFVTFTIVLLPFQVIGYAQEKAISREEVEKATSKIILDKTLKKLPVGFVGNDMYLMFQKINSGIVKSKGEYEKNTSYVSRVNSTVAKSIGLKGFWNAQSVFTALIAPSHDQYESFFRGRYDADLQQIVIPLGSIIKSDQSFRIYSQDSIELKLEFDDVENFPHQVVKGSWNQYEGRYPTWTYIQDYAKKMSPDRAKKIKENLRVLVAFRLLNSSLYSTSEPREDQQFSRAITRVDIKEIWFFNQQTGQIYDKWVAKH